jgi:hypothetical protein
VIFKEGWTFIQENYEEARELFDISRVPGLPKEEGRKPRQKPSQPPVT